MIGVEFSVAIEVILFAEFVGELTFSGEDNSYCSNRYIFANDSLESEDTCRDNVVTVFQRNNIFDTDNSRGVISIHRRLDFHTRNYWLIFNKNSFIRVQTFKTQTRWPAISVGVALQTGITLTTFVLPLFL